MGNSTAATATGSIEAALLQASDLLEDQPELALAQARTILGLRPDHPHAALIQGQALRRLGQTGAALADLSALARSPPDVAAVIWELAQVASEAGEPKKAVAALETLTRHQPA